MNIQQPIRKQYKLITISIHKTTGDKYNERTTIAPHRFLDFAVNTP
jgi:hypothetical protein